MSELERHAVPEGVETDGWTLDVSGGVERPPQLDRSDLTAFPVETLTEDVARAEGWVAEGRCSAVRYPLERVPTLDWVRDPGRAGERSRRTPFPDGT